MAAATTEPLERLEQALRAGPDTPRKRMLIIVNPYATTVSDRLKNLVVYALRGSYQVDAIDTEARDHATELCREAAREGYDVVVAFGGDGTVNEAANGLAGSDTPLSCLPGGRTNVYCRMLGIPTDVVESLKMVAPMKGFTAYQTLLKSYISEGLRRDEAQFDQHTARKLAEALKRRGVEETVLKEALAEIERDF